MLPSQLPRLAPRPSPGRGLCSFLVSTGALALLAGCASLDADWDRPVGKSYRPANHVADGPIPAGLRRVAILPLHGGAWSPADLAPLEAAIAAELGKIERFEVVSADRAYLASRFGRGAFESSAALPGDFLAVLGAEQAADAVLFVDLTHYSPYQPIALGVRAKLVGVAGGRVLWSFDSIFDAAQPDVAVAARRYHLDRSRPAHPLENTSGILQSPARFAKYVAFAMFETLPPRESAENR